MSFCCRDVSLVFLEQNRRKQTDIRRSTIFWCLGGLYLFIFFLPALPPNVLLNMSNRTTKGSFLASYSHCWSQYCFFLVVSSSVSFILQLIYSFQQQRPHSKTMARWLRVELTSIIMQIWGKKRPIVPRSSKFLPPPVLDIQVNKLAEYIQTFPIRIHSE